MSSIFIDDNKKIVLVSSICVDDNTKLTLREIEDRLQKYLHKHYLDKSCLDVKGYKNKIGSVSDCLF